MAFPRTVQPNSTSALWLPTGLRERAQSGRIQLRNITQVGWVWSETWDLLNVKNVAHLAVLAYLRHAWNRQVVFGITHLLTPGSGLTRNGVGTPVGSILVKGAGQTGSSIITDGWPINLTDVVMAGDFVAIAGHIYEVSANSSSNASGECSIPVTPNVFVAPADNAMVTISGVEIQAMIWDMPKFGTNKAPSYYNFTVGFAEVIP